MLEDIVNGGSLPLDTRYSRCFKKASSLSRSGQARSGDLLKACWARSDSMVSLVTARRLDIHICTTNCTVGYNISRCFIILTNVPCKRSNRFLFVQRLVIARQSIKLSFVKKRLFVNKSMATVHLLQENLPCRWLTSLTAMQLTEQLQKAISTRHIVKKVLNIIKTHLWHSYK